MDVTRPLMFNHLSAIDFSKDAGLFLAASSLNRQYWMGQLWYFSKPEAAPDIGQASAVVQTEVGVGDIACLTSDTPKAICGLDSGALQLWELQEGSFTCTAHAQEHDNYVTSLHVSSDQSMAISASSDHRIKVWDMQEFKSVSTFRGHSDTVFCAAFHPAESDLFISCSQDGRLLLWDRRLPKPASLIDHYCSVSVPTCVSWQPGSASSVVVGMECGSLVPRDCRRAHSGETASGAKITSVHRRPVTALAFAPHRPELVASASEDCTAAVSRVGPDGSVVLHKEERHTDFVPSVAWNPESHEMYSCSWDSQVLRGTVRHDPVENVNEKVRQMDVVECTTQTTQSEVGTME